MGVIVACDGTWNGHVVTYTEVMATCGDRWKKSHVVMDI